MRATDRARLDLGILCLASPARLSGWLSDEPRDRRTSRRVALVVRVLGARYVAQAAAGALVDDPRLPPWDAAVDLTHAASMIGLAALLPRHRRLALASAALATGFAVADLRGATR